MKALSDRAAIVVVVALLAWVGLVGGRTWRAARNELELADSFRQLDEPVRAIDHYRRALRWWFPFSPHAEEAVRGLTSIATEAEREGDPATALLAWRSLAGGMAASRFLFSRPSASREHAKDQIARLVAVEGAAAIDANLSSEELAADHRRLLDREASPDPFWATLLLLGFLTWIAFLLLLVQRGFDRTGRPIWPAARRPLWGALVGFASFVLGLFFA